MFTKWASAVSNGALIYWHRRILHHPILSSVILLGFCVGAILLGATMRREFTLTWFVIGLGFLVGDISSLIRVARCKNCGLLVAPAPTYTKECPSCGHIMWP